jgi:hypothetical protein
MYITKRGELLLTARLALLIHTPAVAFLYSKEGEMDLG